MKQKTFYRTLFYAVAVGLWVWALFSKWNNISGLRFISIMSVLIMLAFALLKDIKEWKNYDEIDEILAEQGGQNNAQ